jgi:sterol desaturase/sphingolipid hydroxylase (fatty acid hydroxylase superfamily)
MDDDLWVPIAILATYVTMLAGERWFAARRFEAVPRWRWIGWAFLLMLFAVNGLLPAVLPVSWLAEHALLPGHRLGVAGGVVVGVLAFTFVDYWVHRALHRFDGLWRAIHQVHHGAERVDILGSAVLHPVEVALFVLEGIAVNVFVLGLDPQATAIAGYLGAFMAMFQHWNVRTPRWVGWIVQRPEAHCLHHERHVHGRNYSNLPLWDMIFGTYANPERFDGEVGFEGGRGRRLWAMLAGRDVNRGAVIPAYRPPAQAAQAAQAAQSGA